MRGRYCCRERMPNTECVKRYVFSVQRHKSPNCGRIIISSTTAIGDKLDAA